MGQYWKAVNVDKKEYVRPTEFENLMKMMEHSWRYSYYMNAIMLMLAGPWYGDKVMWVGDYTDLPGSNEGHSLDDDTDTNLYSDVSEKAQKLLQSLDSKDEDAYLKNIEQFERKKSIVDMDQNLYLSLDRYYQKERENPARNNDWLEHPLSLLLAAPGGGGGGDYPYKEEYGYGLFSGNRIAILSGNKALLQKGYTDITNDVSFCEDRKIAVVSQPTVIESNDSVIW